MFNQVNGGVQVPCKKNITIRIMTAATKTGTLVLHTTPNCRLKLTVLCDDIPYILRKGKSNQLKCHHCFINHQSHHKSSYEWSPEAVQQKPRPLRTQQVLPVTNNGEQPPQFLCASPSPSVPDVA